MELHIMLISILVVTNSNLLNKTTGTCSLLDSNNYPVCKLPILSSLATTLTHWPNKRILQTRKRCFLVRRRAGRKGAQASLCKARTRRCLRTQKLQRQARELI